MSTRLWALHWALEEAWAETEAAPALREPRPWKAEGRLPGEEVKS